MTSPWWRPQKEFRKEAYSVTPLTTTISSRPGGVGLMNAEKLKSLLNLVPLSIEGGYYTETYHPKEIEEMQCP